MSYDIFDRSEYYYHVYGKQNLQVWNKVRIITPLHDYDHSIHMKKKTEHIKETIYELTFMRNNYNEFNKEKKFY